MDEKENTDSFRKELEEDSTVINIRSQQQPMRTLLHKINHVYSSSSPSTPTLHIHRYQHTAHSISTRSSYFLAAESLTEAYSDITYSNENM